MKKKSFTRALAGISAAVLLAVSLPPQTIPAMAAENSTQEGGSSQEDQADAPQPAAANEVQAAEGKSDQAEEEKANTSAEMNQEAETSQEGSGSADSTAEAGKSASSAQQMGANLSEGKTEIASQNDKIASAAGNSTIAEEAAAGETADAEECATEGQTIADPAKENVQPEETVTVTYEASEGGHVSKESETFVKGADSAALTGAEAAAEDGYEFIDWTEDGVEVSADAVFIPDVTTIDADTTFTANFKAKEAEETYPAVDFAPMTMSDGTEILVSAPEGAFPAGVQMRASVVAPEQVVDAIAEATPDDDAVNAEQIAAYDISFYLPADPDTEIEPRKAVQVSFENLPLQGEVTKDSSLEVWHIDDSQVANAGDIEKQSTDGDVSVSIKAQAFSTYAIRAKLQRVTSNYTFDATVDLTKDISVTSNVERKLVRSGKISVTIHEQDLLGPIKAEYDNFRNSFGGGFWDQWRLKAFNSWVESAFADRSKSVIPLKITLPEGFSFSNVRTTSNGSSLLLISNDTKDLPYLSKTAVEKVDGKEVLTVYLNFAGADTDRSICYLKDVLTHCTENGTLTVSADYTGEPSNDVEEEDIQMAVSGGSGFLFGNHLAVNVNFPSVMRDIPLVEPTVERITDEPQPLATNIYAGKENDFSACQIVITPGMIDRDTSALNLELRVDLDLSPIRKKLKNILDEYTKLKDTHPGEDISLNDTACTFEEKFTVPDGLTFPDADKDYTIISGSSSFKVAYAEGGAKATADSKNPLKAMGFSFVSLAAPSQTEGNGNTKVVSISLNKDKIATIDDLEQLCEQLSDPKAKLTLQITGIKIDKDAIGQLTVSYVAQGSLNSTIEASDVTKKFQYIFYGQPENSNYNTGTGQFKFQTKIDTGIYGDASVRKSGVGNYDTENSQAFEVNRGDSLDMRAALNVSSIRNLMELYKRFYSKQKDIPDVQFECPATSKFTFNLTAPKGLVFPTDEGAYQLDGSDAFKLTINYLNASSLTVTMTLKSDYDNFKKLYDAIYNNTQNYMVLTIKGVKVADNSPEWMTATGTISGNFSATSKKYGPLLDATWDAVQDTDIEGGGDGTDYKDTENDPSKIKLTVHVVQKPVPVTPETPETPTPDVPSPTNGTPSSSGEIPSSVNVAIPDSEVVPTNTAKVLGASRPATAPIENEVQPAEPQKVLGAKRENQQIATGDDSQMMLYGVLALAAAAGAIIWLVRYRRRER